MRLRLDHRVLLAAIFLTMLVAGHAPQAHGQVAVGDTLRFHYGLTVGLGKLVSFGADSVVLRNDSGDEHYARARVRDVQRLVGHHRGGLLDIAKGAAIGLGVGAAVATYMASSAPSNENRELVGVAIIGSVTIGTLAGTLIGVVASFRHVDSWQPVTLTPRVVVVPGEPSSVDPDSSTSVDIEGLGSEATGRGPSSNARYAIPTST